MDDVPLNWEWPMRTVAEEDELFATLGVEKKSVVRMKRTGMDTFILILNSGCRDIFVDRDWIDRPRC